MRTLASLITFALIFTGVLLVGCVGDLDSNSDVVAEEDPSANIPPETSLTLDHIPQGFGEDTPNPTETEDQVHRVIYGYTYHRSDGNRFVVGKGALPGVEPLDIHLLGRPLWVVAAPGDGGSIWVVVLEGGNVQAFSISEGGYEEISITPASMPPGLPPLLKVEGSAPMLVTPPEDASPLTHPVIVGQTGEWTAYVARNGDLVISDGEEYTRFPVNALPDARILVDETDRLLLLTDATRRYDHGVLGDDLEAGSVTLVETDPKPRVVLRITVSEPGVIEGIAPV